MGTGSGNAHVIISESLIIQLRQGSTARSSPVILSEAKDLSADRDRPFASLRVTRGDCSNGQGQFVQIEPCLNFLMRTSSHPPKADNEV